MLISVPPTVDAIITGAADQPDALGSSYAEYIHVPTPGDATDEQQPVTSISIDATAARSLDFDSTTPSNPYPVGTEVQVHFPAPHLGWHKGVVVADEIWAGQKGMSRKPQWQVHVRYPDGWEQWHFTRNCLPADVVATAPLAAAMVSALSPTTDEYTPAADFMASYADFLRSSISAPMQCVGGRQVACAMLTGTEKAELGRSTFNALTAESDVVASASCLYDLENGDQVDVGPKWVVRAGGVELAIDTQNVLSIHVPKTEGEYRRSPDKAVWRTTRELKMDTYEALKIWRNEYVKSVPKDCEIMRTLWVHNEKIQPDGKKVPAARLCIVGTGMDRERYQSFFDVMRLTSVRIMMCLRAAFGGNARIDAGTALTHGCMDIKDFFQATRTDVPSADGKTQPRLFARCAPDFPERGPNGEEMCKEILVGMQGRIDAGRIAGKALFMLLMAIPEITQSKWDPRLYVLHVGPLASKGARLDAILEACASATYVPQHPPPGWMMFGTHVDDIPHIHTVCHDAKILTYLAGAIQVTYALKFSGWQRMLGAEADVTDHDTYAVVTPHCQTYLEHIIQVHVRDKGRVLITPRHIMSKDGLAAMSPGNCPDVGQPGRTEYLSMQAETRTLIGAGHWAGNWHPQMIFGTNAASKYTQDPNLAVHTFMLQQFMYVYAHPEPPNFGGKGCNSLELAEPTVAPFTPGKKEWGLHVACDASIMLDSISAANQMLAGARIDTLCQRPHLTSPASHISELVAAGSSLHRLLPVRGILLEASIYQDQPTPLYIDSASTIFVIADSAAVKKTMWLNRRATILQEAQMMGDIIAIKIGEHDNFADPETKLLIIRTWRRHLWYVHNLPGDMPP